MKRMLLLALLALLTVLPAQAATPTSGIFNLARYAPTNAELFIGVRTDDDFLAIMDTLEAQLGTLVSDLGGDASTIPDFQRVIGVTFGTVNDAEAADVFQWTGDTMALSIGPGTTTSASSLMAIVTLTDIARAQSFLNKQLSDNVASLGTMGRFQVWDDGNNAYILLASDLMIMVNNITRDELSQLAAENFPRLSGVQDYIDAVETLPEDEYGIGIFARGSAFTDAGLREALTGVTLAVGATLLDGTTYTFDAALRPAEPLLQPLAVTPDFTRFIPATAGAVLHGADLAALLPALFDIAAGMGNSDAERSVRDGFGIVGLNFDEFLSWSKGDFALFGMIDVRPILPSMLGTPPSMRGFPGTFDFALVIEAVNAARAQAFATHIATLAREAAAQGLMTGTTVTDEVINGVNVTVVSNEQSMGQNTTLVLEFAIGASNEVFALGTANAVRSVFRSAADITDKANFINASRYWLPDAPVRLLVDGVTVANLVFVSALGSASTQVGPTQQQQQSVFAGMGADEVNRLLTRVATTLNQATLSVTVTDAGSLLARATVTVGQ